MDLSGQYIKGTGSYEVKEIAPPVSGEISSGNWLNTFSTTWDYFSTSGQDGFIASSNTTESPRVLLAAAMVNGKSYRIRFNASLVNCTASLFASDIGYSGFTNLGAIVNGYNEISFTLGVVSAYLMIPITASGSPSVTITDFTVEEVPQGYPLLDKGTKYLECTSAGTVAFPSKQAYGEWEFDFYKGADANTTEISFIGNDLETFSDGYTFRVFNNEGIYFYQLAAAIAVSAPSYITINTWYRVKITRTPDGEFYLYIKGGAFGNNGWTLMTLSTIGSNPITNTNYTTSQYFVITADAGDRIANIVMRKGVSQ